MDYSNTTKFDFSDTRFYLKIRSISVEKKVIVALHDWSDKILLQYPVKDSFIRGLFGSTLEKRVHRRVKTCMRYAEKVAKERTKYKTIVDNYKTLDILSED